MEKQEEFGRLVLEADASRSHCSGEFNFLS
jgi:hypothetical protein